jgi:hypothetical protein
MLSPHKIDCPTDAEIERSAYNAAFHELGLRWHWDDATYDQLCSVPCERARLRHYLEQAQPHLLRAYDADFLADAILQAKQRCQAVLAQSVHTSMPRFDWSDARWGEVGI